MSDYSAIVILGLSEFYLISVSIVSLKLEVFLVHSKTND